MCRKEDKRQSNGEQEVWLKQGKYIVYLWRRGLRTAQNMLIVEAHPLVMLL